MKKYIFLFGLLFILQSCSYEKILKQSDDLNVIIMQTNFMPTGNIGDTVSFKILASTNDIIKRMQITDKSHDFKPVGDEIKYEMVGELSVDEQGYFNRDVRTLMINYPIILENVSVGDILSMTVKFTTDKSVSTSVTAKVKVGNFLDYAEQVLMNAHPQSSSPAQTRFYNSQSHSAYGFNAVNDKKDSVDIYLVTTSMSSPYPQKFVSPGSSLAKTYADKLIPKPTYDNSVMRNTKFIKVETAWVDIGDDQIRGLDFTNGLEEIEIQKDDRIGFLTEDGRKGVILIFGKNSFSISIKTKVQKLSEMNP